MITAVVPVSPIVSHPETAILDETLDSIRYHLPTAEIIVTFDGVRPEQEHRREAYEEHIRRALWRLDHHYGNAVPFIFDEHLHQTGMLRAIIDEIRTPLLLYCEQDTPIVTDEPIEWRRICTVISGGASNLVRLHHEALILDAHKHMTHGLEFPPEYNGEVNDIDFVRTSQWSQRPHVASVAYYRTVLSYFSTEAKAFVEDRMHGVVDEAFKRDGMQGWFQHRLHVYHPNTGNIKRSYHTDGRAGEPKWDDTQVF